jgi:hypothetical protein
MTDKDLYLSAYTTYGHLSLAEACKMLAYDHNLSHDSVRGRVSRASKIPSNRVALTKALALEPPSLPPSVIEQNNLIKKSELEFDLWQQEDEDRRAIFVSDLHAPFLRWDAYELFLTIAEWFKPHAMTAMNDALDNKGFGRHPDDDPTYKTLWRSDFKNTIALQSTIHRDMNYALHPDGKLLALMGNHDRWLFTYLRKNNPQMAEMIIADYMNRMYHDDGVLQFSRGVYENSLFMSEGLVFVHGLTAGKNPMTNAKKCISYFMGNGKAKSVVQGHTHRAIEIDGLSVGYNGVKFVNSGHLRNNDPEWMPRVATDWTMGIVLAHYNPTKWEHEVDLVKFVEHKDKLIARYQGQEWIVNIDKTKPI